MNEKIDSVQVRVVEDDPKGITINVRNNQNNDGCNSQTIAKAPADQTPQVSGSPPGEPPRQSSRKPRRKRDSIQYRDTGMCRDLVMQ